MQLNPTACKILVNMSEARVPLNIAIVGLPGTGKTTFAKKLIRNKLKRGGRVLVCTTQDDFDKVPEIDINSPELTTFTGIRRVRLVKTNIPKLERFYNGMIVFDDARVYFDPSIGLKSGKIDEVMNSMLISLRHRGLDIVTITHSLDQLPVAIIQFMNYLVLYNTNTSAIKRKNVMPLAEKIVSYQEHIREKAQHDMHYYRIINMNTI